MDKDKIFPSVIIVICIITTFMVSSLNEKVSTGFKIDSQALTIIKNELKEEVISEIKKEMGAVSQRTEVTLKSIEQRFSALNASSGADNLENTATQKSLETPFEARIIAGIAVNKSVEQFEAGNFAEAFLYLKNGVEAKLTDWKSLDKIVAKIDGISKDEKLSPEQKFIVLSDWLDFLSKKFYYIMPEDLPSWKDALFSTNTQIRALNIDENGIEAESPTKLLATDTRLIYSIVNKPFSSAKEAEAQLERLTSIMSGRELPPELEKQVKSWIEQCLALIQSENLYKEFVQTLQEYVETDREFLLNSANNLLASYGEIYKSAMRNGWKINDIVILENELYEAKQERDANFVENDIQPVMAEFQRIASGTSADFEDKVSRLENILQQLAQLYQKLHDGGIIHLEFEAAKAIFDEAVVDLYESKIENMRRGHYNTHQGRIEAYQAFLSEPGDLLAKITNQGSKQRFSKIVDDLKKDLMKTIKGQNDAYQHKALSYIERAHKKYSEFYTTVGNKDKFKEILEYDLGDIDTNILTFEVRKAYEEVFAEMYSVLSTEQKLSLSSKFLNKNKLELQDL